MTNAALRGGIGVLEQGPAEPIRGRIGHAWFDETRVIPVRSEATARDDRSASSENQQPLADLREQPPQLRPLLL